MTLDAIKEAIQHLPIEERRKLADWFEEIEEAAWDESLKRDFAPGGRGEPVANQIRQEIADRRASSLEDGLSNAVAGNSDNEVRKRARLSDSPESV